ncbi:hypothetical protein CsSME_00045143 [Camellia sinensis var. sinensis]
MKARGKPEKQKHTVTIDEMVGGRKESILWTSRLIHCTHASCPRSNSNSSAKEEEEFHGLPLTRSRTAARRSSIRFANKSSTVVDQVRPSLSPFRSLCLPLTRSHELSLSLSLSLDLSVSGWRWTDCDLISPPSWSISLSLSLIYVVSVCIFIFIIIIF